MKTANRFAYIAGAILIVGGAFFLWHSQPSRPPKVGGGAEQEVEQQPLKIPAAPKSSTQAQVAPVNSSAGTPVAIDGTVVVPQRYRLPGVEKVRTAKNFKDWLALFPQSDQVTILDFDKSHFSVYSTITSPQQVAWMVEHGYPMPEDILAAKALSDNDLRQLADQGNDKAGFLLAERQATAIRARIDAYVAAGGTKEQLFKTDKAFAVDDMRANSYSQSLYSSSDSAYKGYAMAQEASFSSDQSARSSKIIAGLLWAGQYDDTRATNDALNKFTAGNPALQAEATAALTMLNTLAADQRRQNCVTAYPGGQIPDKVWGQD